MKDPLFPLVIAQVSPLLAAALACSSCASANYRLDPDSRLPRRVATDPEMSRWKNPRLYYAYYGDHEVTVDVWSGLLRHAHLQGLETENEPQHGRNPARTTISLGGMSDQYGYHYNRELKQQTILVLPFHERKE